MVRIVTGAGRSGGAGAIRGLNSFFIKLYNYIAAVIYNLFYF
jgi:hypothetical protein